VRHVARVSTFAVSEEEEEEQQQQEE
jgi:hypothetical protein